MRYHIFCEKIKKYKILWKFMLTNVINWHNIILTKGNTLAIKNDINFRLLCKRGSFPDRGKQQFHMESANYWTHHTNRTTNDLKITFQKVRHQIIPWKDSIWIIHKTTVRQHRKDNGSDRRKDNSQSAWDRQQGIKDMV